MLIVYFKMLIFFSANTPQWAVFEICVEKKYHPRMKNITFHFFFFYKLLFQMFWDHDKNETRAKTQRFIVLKMCLV